MIVKLTLTTGEEIWINMMHLIVLHADGEGSKAVMAGGNGFTLKETPKQFWEAAAGRGGVQVPGRGLVTA